MRDGLFRLYEDSPHRASSGPLRLLRWSRGDWAGLKADVQILVTSYCTRAVLTVFTQEQPDYIGLKVEDPFNVGGMEVEGSAEVVVAGSGLGVRVVARHCQLMD